MKAAMQLVDMGLGCLHPASLPWHAIGISSEVTAMQDVHGVQAS